MKENESLKLWAFVFLLFLFLSLVAADQYLKGQAFRSESTFTFLNFGLPILGKVNYINQGFAFGLPLAGSLASFLYVPVLFFVAVRIFKTFRTNFFYECLAWTLVFSGGISNAVERWLHGGVRDFIFFLGGIFNPADAWILVGLLLLAWPRKKAQPMEKL